MNVLKRDIKEDKTLNSLIGKGATIAIAIVTSLSVMVFDAGAEPLDKKLVSEQAYKAYQVGNYERALELYNKIGEQAPSPLPELDFNKGAVKYRLGSFEDAAKDFDNAALARDRALAENAHFNMGNTYFQGQQYDKAVEQYKEALKLNPSDTDSKYNLELALRQLQQQEKKDKNKDKDKDKDKDKQDEDKDKQDKQDRQDEDKEKQDQQDKNKDQRDEQQKQDDQRQNSQPDSTQSQDQQNQKKQAQPQQMSKEDAERLLNSLKDEEMKQQQRKVLLSSYRYKGKKW